MDDYRDGSDFLLNLIEKRLPAFFGDQQFRFGIVELEG